MSQVNKWHLQRLVWIIQKRLSEEIRSVPIEIVAEELVETAVMKIRGELLGEAKSTVIDLEVPDGPWQALKACFGFSCRTKCLRVDAFQVFPDLRVPREQKTVVYIEAEENANVGG